MTCDEARERLSAAPAGLPPAGVAEHMRGCAGCAAHARRDETIRRLMALKRHEQPDAHFETRLLARVRDEIAGTVPGRRWLPGWLAGRAGPVLRYAAAAAALAILAVRWLGPAAGTGPASGPAVADQPAPAAAPALAPFAKPVPPPMIPVEYASLPLTPTNLGAGGIQYGPGASVPVKFEY